MVYTHSYSLHFWLPMVPSKKDLNKSIISTRMTIVDGEITVYGQKFEECMLVENVTNVF